MSRLTRKLKDLLLYKILKKDRIAYFQTSIGNYYLPIDISGDAIINEMKEGRIFEPEIIEIAKKFITKGSTVLDVGANLGQMTLLFSEMVGNEGKVYSFEADDYMAFHREWDDEHISHSKIPDSALDLFKDKISKLSDEDRNILAVASCLGARFNIEDLARVTKCSESELHEKLTEVYAQNILLNEKNQLLFFHDQVQAAAETFMNEEKKQRVHHAIAEAFIKDIPENSHYEHLPNLFAIVEHLSKGRLANTEKHDLYEEAQFNYHAGIAAMKSLAVDNANFFFEQARHLFPYDINNWGEHYNFLFLLYKYNARTEMALGNQSASEKILDILDKQCNTDLDRIDCLYEQTGG